MIQPGSSNGTVYLFDPEFCGTGPNTTGGYYGTGDHWIGTAGTPVSTYFTLWNENDTPYQIDDDILVASSGTLFENENQTDQSQSSGNYIWGTPQRTTAQGTANCATSIHHNRWWQMATGLAAGSYRLQVSTTNTGNSAINSTTNAENMWSIEATASGGAAPQVHGTGRMAQYNNLESGLQKFYLARIDAAHGGKTLQIDLFDPGDVSGNAYLRILTPNGNTYNYVTFSYTTDNQCSANCSGTNVTQIQTAANGASRYNNTWITISIPLPSTYGSCGPDAARRDRGGLVEDRVQRLRRQRHDHLACPDPRQPRPPDRPLTDARTTIDQAAWDLRPVCRSLRRLDATVPRRRPRSAVPHLGRLHDVDQVRNGCAPARRGSARGR